MTKLYFIHERLQNLFERNLDVRMELEASSKMADEELEGLIRYYFVRGFEYVQIVRFLSKYTEK